MPTAKPLTWQLPGWAGSCSSLTPWLRTFTGPGWLSYVGTNYKANGLANEPCWGRDKLMDCLMHGAGMGGPLKSLYAEVSLAPRERWAD